MEELTKAYRATFSGHQGALVLADILSLLGFFSNTPETINPMCIAVGNTILSRLQVFGSEGCAEYVGKILESRYSK